MIRRSRGGYFLFCLIVAACVAVAIWRLLPAEAWEALKGTYMRPAAE